MSEQPDDAALRAASDAIDRACAEMDQCDPEAAAHSYRDKVNAPLRPETIAALNERLAAGNMPTVLVPRRDRD
jgi:hypothetical protein